MKIYYFNDTKKPQTVFVGTLLNEEKTLEPATGSYFKLYLRDDCCPFIKVWENGIVLISDIDIKK